MGLTVVEWPIGALTWSDQHLVLESSKSNQLTRQKNKNGRNLLESSTWGGGGRNTLGRAKNKYNSLQVGLQCWDLITYLWLSATSKWLPLSPGCLGQDGLKIVFCDE